MNFQLRNHELRLQIVHNVQARNDRLCLECVSVLVFVCRFDTNKLLISNSIDFVCNDVGWFGSFVRIHITLWRSLSRTFYSSSLNTQLNEHISDFAKWFPIENWKAVRSKMVLISRARNVIRTLRTNERHEIETWKQNCVFLWILLTWPWRKMLTIFLHLAL